MKEDLAHNPAPKVERWLALAKRALELFILVLAVLRGCADPTASNSGSTGTPAVPARLHEVSICRRMPARSGDQVGDDLLAERLDQSAELKDLVIRAGHDLSIGTRS